MQSNYRKIGSFIKRLNNRNTGLLTTNLLGINIDKYFMPSVANVHGTNLSKYKLVYKNQFACNRMHVGRDERLPIALSNSEEPFIVSPAYDVFEITNTKELLPQYLMMWFSRKEFDRNTWFYTDSDVRGKLGWEDFCNMELPVPSIEKQRAIVKEYNTVVHRIQLNERLNQKLEETAQALYRHWFVDFEFPDENGQPYKSSGGKMVWNEELEKEIPEGWELKQYSDIFNFTTGKLNSNAAVINGIYPFFTCSSETYLTNTFSFDCEALILAGNNARAVYPFKYYNGKFDAYQRTYVVTPKENKISIYQGYFEILNQLEGFKGVSSGTATKFLTMKILNPLKVLTPPKLQTLKYNQINIPIFRRKLLIQKTIDFLYKLKDTVLRKMSKIILTS